MRASSNDIYVNGEYFKKHPDWDVADAPWKTAVIYKLLQQNQINPDEVTEVGCGAGENLVELLKRDGNIKKLTGYDISPQAIALASGKSTGKISFYNEDITLKEHFHTNLMLVIDVVEHVDDFYGFLRKLKGMSDYFVFHIPLDLSCRTLLKPHVLLQQRSSVGHIHYFSKEMVLWALQDTGYQVMDWEYTKPVVDIHPPDSIKRRIKKILRNISFAIDKEGSVKKWGGYSMMILAK